MENALYTIGHSNHPMEAFIELLRGHGVTTLADVRSHPVSRFAPHFSYAPLQTALREAGLRYLFLGRELGGRTENPASLRHGQVQFELLAQEPQFQKGLARVRQEMALPRVALMCAEKDPVECHRALLVARMLHQEGASVRHILADGGLLSHDELESRLLALHGLPEQDLFHNRGELIQEAYARQGRRSAFRSPMEPP